MVPVHKKRRRQNIKNYRLGSLLPICGKVFDRILFSMFSFFSENNLTTQRQSGFKPVDSGINQLLSIAHQIYKPFDDEFEKRNVF